MILLYTIACIAFLILAGVIGILAPLCKDSEALRPPNAAASPGVGDKHDDEHAHSIDIAA